MILYHLLARTWNFSTGQDMVEMIPKLQEHRICYFLNFLPHQRSLINVYRQQDQNFSIKTRNSLILYEQSNDKYSCIFRKQSTYKIKNRKYINEGKIFLHVSQEYNFANRQVYEQNVSICALLPLYFEKCFTISVFNRTVCLSSRYFNRLFLTFPILFKLTVYSARLHSTVLVKFRWKNKCFHSQSEL